MLSAIYRLILRRKHFKGQFKLFLWLYSRNKLKIKRTITKPLIGNFNINVVTTNYIDAWIYYAGDYESFVKKYFKTHIKPGDTVLDVGANIGFHTLYLAELVGASGKVIAVEPMPVNFKALEKNIALNNFNQIITINSALSSKNETINIYLNPTQHNPGAYNLFEEGEKNTLINCVKGDDLLTELSVNKVALIKIDVEGFEFEVLKGLYQTILKDKPVIIFEYDRNYQLKNNQDPAALFSYLINLNYSFLSIKADGSTKAFKYTETINGAEILALPIN